MLYMGLCLLVAILMQKDCSNTESINFVSFIPVSLITAGYCTILQAGFALAVAIVAICEDFYFLAPKI